MQRNARTVCSLSRIGAESEGFWLIRQQTENTRKTHEYSHFVPDFLHAGFSTRCAEIGYAKRIKRTSAAIARTIPANSKGFRDSRNITTPTAVRSRIMETE